MPSSHSTYIPFYIIIIFISNSMFKEMHPPATQHQAQLQEVTFLGAQRVHSPVACVHQSVTLTLSTDHSVHSLGVVVVDVNFVTVFSDKGNPECRYRGNRRRRRTVRQLYLL